MSRRSGNISIKQLSAAAETSTTINEDGTTTTTTIIPSGIGNTTSDDVETVVQTMINNDKILDENDVNELIDAKLQDYTNTSDLQNDYPTKTLLSNTLDNYASKELLTQSLSEKANYTTTDALASRATDCETRIKGLEDNFVSTTVLTETLTNYATSSSLSTGLSGKANSSHTHSEYAQASHTHTLSDITDYSPTDLTNIEEDINELTEQVLEIENVIDSKASSSHTHTISEITDYSSPDLGNLSSQYVNFGSSSENTNGIKIQTDKLQEFAKISYKRTYDDTAQSGNIYPNHLRFDLYGDHNGEVIFETAEDVSGGRGVYRNQKTLTLLDSNGNSTFPGTITSSNVLATNESRLAACETAIDGKASSSHTHSEYAQASHTHTLSDITDYTAPTVSTAYDDSNCAKLNQANTFTLSDANVSPELQVLNTAKSSGSIAFALGNGTSWSNQFRIGYYPAENSTYMYSHNFNFMDFLYSSSTPQVKILAQLAVTQKISCPSLTLNGNDLQTTLDGKASTSHTHSGYASSTHTHSSYSGTFNANQFETNYSSASNALGSNLQNAIFDLIYPVGSIYITYTQPSGIYQDGSYLKVQIHGCTFRLLDSDLFLRNVSWSANPSNATYSITYGGGSTGGSLRHTHTLSSDGYAKIAVYTDGYVVSKMTQQNSNTTSSDSWTKGASITSSPGSAYTKWATDLGGTTDSASNLPPYIQVYMWRRIA